MRWLIKTSLDFRGVVAVLAALLMVLGVRAAGRMSIDVFPEFAEPRLEIQVEAPGLSTEEVESLVTAPLENAVNGIPGVETMRSKSVLGLSSILLIFDEHASDVPVRQLVQEHVALVAGTLPAVADRPIILPPLSSLSRVLQIGVTSRTLSRMELSELARWTIRPRLMSVPGVANVAIWGQRDRQLLVLVDPDRLRAHGTPLDRVVARVGEAVAPGSGGFVDTPNQRLPVRQVAAVREPRDLAEILVEERGGAPLLLGHLAEVRAGFPPPIGDAVVNDEPGLLMIVEKHPRANTLDVTRRIDAALAELAPGLEGVDLDASIFRPATFIEAAVGNLAHAMVVGCVLVVAVLVLFLFDWRAALISAVAIPLSLVAAAVLLHARTGTMNTMVLAGLVIALGSVVDDAIIDVENIVRRLRLNRAAAPPRPAFGVVLEASMEVRGAIVYASAIVMLVFLPVLFLEGVAGSFFRPLALAYVAAIVASLVVALSVTPALSLLLLPALGRGRGESVLVRGLKRAYRAALPPIARRPRAAAAAIVAALVAAGAALPWLGQEYLPRFQERDFLMHWIEKPGTSLEAMSRITRRVSCELRAIPGVNHFGSHIGRAEAADEVVGPNFAELWISVDPEADYDEVLSAVQEVVAGYPGLKRDVLTYLRERVKEVLTGTSASIVVRIYGPDLGGLRECAELTRAAIAGVSGVANLQIEQQEQVPQAEIRFRPEAAARLGVSRRDVEAATRTMIQGTKAGEVYGAQRSYDVMVRGAEHGRRDLAALAALPIDAPGGGIVRLGDVADILVVPAPNAIVHENARRRILVTCDVAGRDLSSVAGEIEERVGGVRFPRGYYPEVTGEHVAARASRGRLLGFAGLSLLAIAVLLFMEFRTLRLVLLVALSVPFALIGGVAAAFAGGGVLSLGSLVGFVAVLGIATRNGIMLVSHYRQLEQVEGVPFGEPLVLRGAEERLAPILMTALTTALGLLPLVIGGGRPGHEIEHPMAIVILGGLTTSTALNLFLLPALYGAWGAPGRVRR